MKNNVYIFYPLTVCLLGCLLIACKPQDPQLKQLDEELTKREWYHNRKKQRLDSLTLQINNSIAQMSATEKYAAVNQLYKGYASFRFDSAYKYTSILCSIGKTIDPTHMIDSKIKHSSILSNGGFFKEAIDSLTAIELTQYTLPDSIRADYYIAIGRIYHNLADYTSDRQFTPLYNSMGNDVLEEAVKLVDDPVTIYWLKGKMELKRQNLSAAKEYFEQAAGRMPENHPRKGVILSTLAHIYYRTGDLDNAKYYYAIRAIENVKNASLESVSLRGLATVLFYQKKDINTATRYINIALDDATQYSARHRKMAVNSLLPIIVGEKLEMVETRQGLLFRYFTLIILLTVGLIILFGMNILQLKKLRRHKKLVEDTNQKLSEANLIKEEFIGHYFHINSTIVNQVDRFTQVATNKLKLKQYDDVKRLIDTLAKAHNKKAFYKEFDKSFLKIFPNFIEEFNKLMPEPDRITLPEGELNTTLRIFALIRLDITDSEEIARIMDNTLNTVYNYRLRARKKSTVGSEQFEKHIKNIGI